MMMNSFLRTGLCYLTVLLLFTSCHKKEWDSYYGRPSSLAPPIYQELQERGNFTHLLAAIDKSGYQETLNRGGYWTMFAPNDDAFEKFFQENGIKGDEGVDSALAGKIVRYALVYNAYRKAQLADAQASGGADTLRGFKRKTAYYNFVYTENGRKVISANRNGTYDPSDNNNKYIPYFIDQFLSFNHLSPSDYTFFYPNASYSGFNVAGAQVVNADIAAENGIIDEVDKVILPLPSLEDYLNSNPDYSEFKRLLDKLVSYQSNADITERNYALTGSMDSVYVKLYDAGGANGLAFSPNNENFVLSSTDAQSDGWSMVVPTNEALISYEKEILAHFGSFDAAPPTVLIALLNAHLWPTTIWPSRLDITPNSEQELPTFSISDITDKKVCSNGFFFGSSKVQQANVFRTIYGKAFLDPAFSLMTRALDQDIKFSIINPQGHFTMFMMSDKVLAQYGYSYDDDHSEWIYQAPGGTQEGGAGALARVNRILQTSLAVTQNGELDDLSGEGIAETWTGEYIRYKNNTVWAGGNADAGTVVHIDSVARSVNGVVYYVDGLLTFSENTLGYHIEQLANSDPDSFGSFYNYLTHTALWNGDTKTILGIQPGTFYTAFIPTNAAISEAVKEGLLPGDANTGVPDFEPGAPEDQNKVVQFITYHILDKNTVVPDGKKSGSFATLLKTIDGDLTFIKIDNQIGQMKLTDTYGDTANLIEAQSNHLCDRAVIHSIDHVLNYNAH